MNEAARLCDRIAIIAVGLVIIFHRVERYAKQRTGHLKRSS